MILQGGGGGAAPSYQPQHQQQPPYGQQQPPFGQQQPFYPQEQQSIVLASLEQYQGTILPAPNFNAEADCQALSQAMRGAGRSKNDKNLNYVYFIFKVPMNEL